MLWILCFNSVKVQLREATLVGVDYRKNCFNSVKVQLRACDCDIVNVDASMFQFRKGAIKSHLTMNQRLIDNHVSIP